MNNFENRKISSGELETHHNIVVVDFLRHGSTDYIENTLTSEQKANFKGDRPKDLTSKGEMEVQKTAEEIARKVDRERDIVVLWSSPAWRAQDSEDILRKSLEERGIEIYKDSTVPTMRNFEQRDPSYVKKIFDFFGSQNITPEVAYFRKPEFKTPNEKFETQGEVKKRMERLFNWIRYIVEHAEIPQGKRLHFVGVSHFELLNQAVEQIYGPNVETDSGIKKGEGISFTFDYNSDSKELKISADFRGEHKDITFDKNARTFNV